MKELLKEFITPSFIQREKSNPVLTPEMLPGAAVITYNAGVAKFNGLYVMLFTNCYEPERSAWQQRSEECLKNGKPFTWPPVKCRLDMAVSSDGIHWKPTKQYCCNFMNEEVTHVADPRSKTYWNIVNLCRK